MRAAEPEDMEAVVRILSDPGVIAGTLQLPYSAIAPRVERFSQHQPGRYSLVAEVDGEIVGNLSLMVIDRPRRRHVAEMGIAVRDEFQGKGVGTALMTAMIELAERWIGIERVELVVHADNAPAIHLYEKFGFAIEGTARRYALRDGQYVDAHYMARLRPQEGAGRSG